MITIQRPGQEPLEIESIVIDFEGTLAQDARVHPKAKDKINLLSKRTKILIVANREKETVEKVLRKVHAEILYLTEGGVSKGKLNALRRFDPKRTAVIGNGIDDAPIFEEVALGICVVAREGASVEAIKKADLVVTNILDGLDFLLKPLRQKATLGL